MTATPGRVLRIAAPILIASVVLAFGVASLEPSEPLMRSAWLLGHEGLEAAESQLVEHLSAHPEDAAGWRTLVRQRGQSLSLKNLGAHANPTADPQELKAVLEKVEKLTAPHLDDDAFDAFLNKASEPSPAILRALYAFHRGDPLDKTTATLRGLEGSAGPAEAARLNLVAAPATALTLADEALTRGENTLARQMALKALARLHKTEELMSRLQDPGWAAHADARLRLDAALDRNDVLGIVEQATRARLEKLDVKAHLSALVAGLCWLVVLLLLGGFRAFSKRAKAMSAAAVLLGVLSGTLTLAAAVWLNHSLDHSAREHNEVYLLAYYVLGVGFKEEAIKLLCFLPLLPLALRLKSDVAVLILPSLVGLGFAIEENTGYFAHGAGDVVLGRFLTANFLHITLTGIAGYFLVQAIRRGGESWNTFTAEFFKVVGVHGLYDYLLSTRLFEGGPFFAIMVFVLLSQWYLRLLVNMKRPSAPPSDRMMVYFTLALSLAFGTNLVFSAAAVGFQGALEAMFLGALGNVLIATMFYREL